MIENIKQNEEALKKQYKQYRSTMLTLLKKDYPIILKTDLDELTSELPEYFKTSLPNIKQGTAREATAHAWWCLATATAQVRAYKMEKGILPESLDAFS